MQEQRGSLWAHSQWAEMASTYLRHVLVKGTQHCQTCWIFCWFSYGDTEIWMTRCRVKKLDANWVRGGSRLAHLYALPKTHTEQKNTEQLAMCSIISATGAYNYELAKWLDNKLKPLSVNQYTITDCFPWRQYVEWRSLKEKCQHRMTSHHSLRTFPSIMQAIQFVPEKAFPYDWLNKMHQLNITKFQLVELLEVAMKDC